MRMLLGAAASAAVMYAAIDSTIAADYVMKVGTASINDPQWHYMQTFETELEALSDGRIDVELYPQSQLGAMPRQIEGVQLGTIEAFIGPADFYVGSDPRFGVFSTPLLFENNENAANTIFDPELNPILRELGQDQGFVNIGWVIIGPTHYASLEPINSVEDFTGLKLRVNGTDMEREKMRRLGATGLPMPLGDVLPALQRKEIDGTQSATSIFVAFHFDDVVKDLTVTNDTMVISPVMVSKAWFTQLPTDLQEAVVQAGLNAQTETDTWQRAFVNEVDEVWRSRGGRFIQLDGDDLAKFNSLLESIGDEMTASNAAVNELYLKIREVARSH